MNYEEFMKYVDKMDNNIRKKLKDNEEELTFYSQLVISLNAICEENQKPKEVIDKANKYLHTRGIKQWPNGTYYRGLDGLQVQVLKDILKEVSE